jgi:hypothetical protein
MSSFYKHFIRLLKKYSSGKADSQEQLFVERYYDYFENNIEGIVDKLSDEDKQATELRMFFRIKEKVDESPVVPIHSLWKKIAVAAILLLVASTAFLFIKTGSQKNAAKLAHHDVAPATNGAILTLANGQTIVLDSLSDGVVSQGITMKNRGLSYQFGSLTGTNTLVTPKGRTFQVTLSDGTDVWLNAGSSITYPVSFSANEARVVEMTGECYFEVKHNASQPFKVKVGREVVEDIGTHFNIKAYEEEGPVKATLLDGAVKIREVVLRPGEQFADGKVKTVDTDKVMAWKNGYFSFDDVYVTDVMKQLERWYDVTFEFKGKITSERFSGEINRNIPLSALLKELERPGLHFQYKEDRKIIIQP